MDGAGFCMKYSATVYSLFFRWSTQHGAARLSGDWLLRAGEEGATERDGGFSCVREEEEEEEEDAFRTSQGFLCGTLPCVRQWNQDTARAVWRHCDRFKNSIIAAVWIKWMEPQTQISAVGRDAGKLGSTASNSYFASSVSLNGCAGVPKLYNYSLFSLASYYWQWCKSNWNRPPCQAKTRNPCWQNALRGGMTHTSTTTAFNENKQHTIKTEVNTLMAELRGEPIHMEINTISAGLKGRCGTVFANKQTPFLS